MTDLTEAQYKTVTGTPTSAERCVYRDGPHVYIVLAYAPGQVLQVLCQHCLLLASYSLGETAPVPIEDDPRMTN